MKNFRQRIPLLLGEIIHRAQVPGAEQHDLEGPNRPEWHEYDKIGVPADDALSALQFQFQVITQQA